MNPLKFSIVTPTYNGERYIRETIESVISQAGTFLIEYIIQDGGSTDGTEEIVRVYQRLIQEGNYPIKCAGVSIHWHSGKDDGMYDAINKGFEMASGDIYAYINSDDVYLPGAFNTMAIVFEQYPEIEWVHGVTSVMNGNSTICYTGQCELYARNWIAKGLYGKRLQFINQEAVFWRKNLWRRVGRIDSSLKLAGDYYLWTRFAQHSPLVTVKAFVSCFRVVEGQLSGNMLEYQREMDRVCPRDTSLGRFIKLVMQLRKMLSPRHPIPSWMRVGFLRAVMLVSRNEYFAIKISTNNVFQYHKGNYRHVSRELF